MVVSLGFFSLLCVNSCSFSENDKFKEHKSKYNHEWIRGEFLDENNQSCSFVQRSIRIGKAPHFLKAPLVICLQRSRSEGWKFEPWMINDDESASNDFDDYVENEFSLIYMDINHNLSDYLVAPLKSIGKDDVVIVSFDKDKKYHYTIKVYQDAMKNKKINLNNMEDYVYNTYASLASEKSPDSIIDWKLPDSWR